MKHIKNFKQLFEIKTGQKLKTRWTVDDAIITLYHEKFGLKSIGVPNNKLEEFVAEYIGSTLESLKMQALNVKFILTSPTTGKTKGLRNFSNAQVEAVEKYRNFSKIELREKVKNILDGVTESDRLNNAIAVETGVRTEIPEDKVPLIIKQREAISKTTGKPLKDFFDGIDTNATIPVKPGDILTHKTKGDGFVFEVYGDWMEIRFYNENEPTDLIYKPDMFIDKNSIVDIPKTKPKTIKKSRSYKQWEREKEERNRKQTKSFKNYKPEIIPEIIVNPYKIGDTVNHRKFGEGEVINIDNNFLNIDFNGDIKKISYKPQFFI